MIVATPDFPPLLAFTLLANVPVVAPAVNRPEEASTEPPLFTTLHEGVIGIGFPASSVPTAESCAVAPGASVCGFGETAMLASELGELASRFPHAVAKAVSMLKAASAAARAVVDDAARAERYELRFMNTPDVGKD
jgi:hypothetical protein